MNRVKMILVVVLSLFVGGIVMHQSSSSAQPADPWGGAAPPPLGPVPPMPPAPPKGPKPPKPPKAPRGGISISIHGNKVQIDGLEQLVQGHLAAVRQMLDSNPNIPKDVRDRIVARMDKVKAIVEKNLANLSGTDIDKLDDQLEKMGDQLEKAMEGLDGDLAKISDKVGKKMAKDIAKDLGKLSKKNFQFHWDGDDSNDSSDASASSDSNDSSDDSSDSSDDTADASDDQDVQVAIDDLKNFSLKQSQRDAIARVRETADKQVAAAKIQLDQASKALENALENVKVTDEQVSQAVLRVTAAEAEIRKARLLSWVQARRQLDADQIKRLEAALKKTR
jgi:hypothetical protein